jgi:hypothetical protein
MGLRNKSTTGKKLTVKTETLRKLQLRTLSDDELRAAPGGMGTRICCGTDTCAPSHVGC